MVDLPGKGQLSSTYQLVGVWVKVHVSVCQTFDFILDDDIHAAAFAAARSTTDWKDVARSQV